MGENEAQWGCSIHTCPRLGEDGQVTWSTGLGTEAQGQTLPITASVSGSWVALASCPSNSRLLPAQKEENHPCLILGQESRYHNDCLVQELKRNFS